MISNFYPLKRIWEDLFSLDPGKGQDGSSYVCVHMLVSAVRGSRSLSLEIMFPSDLVNLFSKPNNKTGSNFRVSVMIKKRKKSGIGGLYMPSSLVHP